MHFMQKYIHSYIQIHNVPLLLLSKTLSLVILRFPVKNISTFFIKHRDLQSYDLISHDLCYMYTLLLLEKQHSFETLSLSSSLFCTSLSSFHILYSNWELQASCWVLSSPLISHQYFSILSFSLYLNVVTRIRQCLNWA